MGDYGVTAIRNMMTGDISSGVLAAGVPCRVIRKIDRGSTKWWES